MKKNTIDDYQSYLNSTENESLTFGQKDNRLLIKAILINDKIITDIMLVVISICLPVFLKTKVLYFIPVYATLCYFILWVDFSAINNLTIHLNTQTLLFESRSIIRRLLLKKIFNKKDTYPFTEVIKFSITDNKTWRASETRHFINMHTTDNRKVILISFKRKDDAAAFLTFISGMLYNY